MGLAGDMALRRQDHRDLSFRRRTCPRGSSAVGRKIELSRCVGRVRSGLAPSRSNRIGCRTYSSAPVVLVKDGRLVHDNMRKARVSESDLLEGLRQEGGVDSVEKVKCAYLELNGEIKVVAREP